MHDKKQINVAPWIFILNVLLFSSSNTSGDISSLYDSADHYWDFEQSPVSQIADQRTGTPVTVHGSPTTVDSPTGKSIYLQGTTEINSSLNLMQGRKGRSINNTQTFFGNSEGTELRQGVTIYYNDTDGFLNAAVFGSTNYCYRWLKMVLNSWTHIHLKWNSSGELNVYVEKSGHSDHRYVRCGNITTSLPTEETYSLGHAAFPTAYFDNLAIWYQDKPLFPEPWDYITDFGGDTTLSLTMTLWDKQWDQDLSNNGSQEFQTLQKELVNQIAEIYKNNNGLSQTDVQQFTSGSVNALVRLKFVERTSWEDSIALQESLESEEFLGGTAASITECTAGDGSAGLIGPITILETLEEVPSSGPVILEAYSINRTSVFVRWNETSIPKNDWHGIPRGFRVHGKGRPCTGFKVTPYDVGLNVSSFTVTGLQAWVVYVVKVSGVTTPGHGVASEVEIKTNDSVPSKGPSNIRIVHTSNHSVKITWDKVKVCFVHGPIKSYEVHFRDVEGGSTDLMHNITVLTGEERRLDFTNLEIYWMYGVSIKAFTILGGGPLSSEITGMTDEWVPIVAPSNVSAFDPGPTSIRLSWYFENKVRDVLGILTGFRIFYQLANSSSAPIQQHEVGANSTEVHITGLDIYRFYNISVAGMTRIGHGVISENVYMRTLGTAPLHHPVPIEMSNTSSTSLHVAWGEVPDAYHHGEVMGYRVFLEETGYPGVIVTNRTFPLHINITDFTGLKKFTNYTARVRAYSFFGEGPDGTVTKLTDEDIPSQAPADLELFNTSSTTLRAVWAQVPDCCRHGIIRGYRLFFMDNNTGEFVMNETAAAGRYELDFTSLLKFYGYSVSILAFTIKGDGPLSEVSAMTEEDDAVGPLARQTTLTTLEEYRDYNITVTAFIRIGDGANSPFMVIRTDEHGLLQVTSVATNTSSTSLRVNWGEVPFPDQLGIIRGYRVLMWRTNQSADILRNVTLLAPSRAIDFSGLEKYTNYTIQVLAFTVKGEGNKSEPIVVITDEDGK
ncbi:hypothetical protein OS493_007495 [Desmophyllum pertusum]|uniref:Uncharacterized protein n=1 Tax=Desmophyllum pertusum TaxID=174260 RepID=A0A9W9Z3I3_9CNID|nr:hypothetical protein OS493_007495 [Desmophyllum pertusum]